MCWCYALFFLLSAAFALEKNVLMTEVFEIVIDPPLFNWTYEGKNNTRSVCIYANIRSAQTNTTLFVDFVLFCTQNNQLNTYSIIN